MSEGSGANRRARQAEQTRREIVATARRLFAAKGYAATSVAQIAAAAGVSVQTIYDSLGSKAAIVRALNDLLDEEGDVRSIAARIPTATDPQEVLAVAVDISRNINERCDDIVSVLYGAGGVDEGFAAVRDESRRRHRAGVNGLARRLGELGALKDGLSVDAAADITAALTESSVARTFVVDYGWSWQQWRDWTLDALAVLVLAEPPRRPAKRRRT